MNRSLGAFGIVLGLTLAGPEAVRAECGEFDSGSEKLIGLAADGSFLIDKHDDENESCEWCRHFVLYAADGNKQRIKFSEQNGKWHVKGGEPPLRALIKDQPTAEEFVKRITAKLRLTRATAVKPVPCDKDMCIAKGGVTRRFELVKEKTVTGKAHDSEDTQTTEKNKFFEHPSSPMLFIHTQVRELAYACQDIRYSTMRWISPKG